MIDISILNEQNFLDIDKKLEQSLFDLIELVLKKENIDKDAEVSVMFVDDLKIHELNKIHRHIDKSTDVLSFPQYESLKDKDNLDDYLILGDIVISTETATRQAKEYNHSLLREIGFLVVHSMFHLLGYDHDTDANTKIMRQKEELVLNDYNLTR